jgi:hypothetical protein
MGLFSLGGAPNFWTSNSSSLAGVESHLAPTSSTWSSQSSMSASNSGLETSSSARAGRPCSGAKRTVDEEEEDEEDEEETSEGMNG